MPNFDGRAARIFYAQSGPQTAEAPEILWIGGGGTRGRDWQRFQTPRFDRRFRSTVFDNRGIGETACRAPNLFATSPEKYAPQYDGYCAWALTEARKAQSDPEVWEIVNGKLYPRMQQSSL